MARILIVDDEKKLCLVLQGALEEEGHEVHCCFDGNEGMQAIEQQNYDILLTDLRLPGVDGLKLLQHSMELNPEAKVVLMTAHASASTAVTAMKEGAFDYLTKPFSLDSLFDILEKIEAFQKKTEDPTENLIEWGSIVGKSLEMIKVFKLVGQIAAQDVTILIRGESGTGKELVAQAIHHASPRMEFPLITVNCTAVPESLFENELFGHDREAYTGASSEMKGRFELANGGSLFLDEIGDLSISSQAKLLRVLENKSFQRVGGTKTITSDVRIITATNVNLEKAVEEKRFREDLYYRLNVFPITLPPLRKRSEDIPLLIKYFLAHSKTNTTDISDSAMDILMKHKWPGNVRELQNTIVASALRAKGGTLTVEDLPENLNQNHLNTNKTVSSMDLTQAEYRLIEQAIFKANGNKTRAAEMLGITRRALYSRLKNMGYITSMDEDR